MTLVHADNFNYYGTSALMLDGVYGEVTSGATIQSDPDGVSAGKVLRTAGNGSGPDYARYVLPASVTTFGIGFRLWMAALPTQTTGLGAQTPTIALRDGSNNIMFTLWVTTTGAIVVSSGTNPTGAVLGQSAGPVLAANGWYHIELKFVVSATVGSVEVRVEGVAAINATALNTGSTSIAQFSFGRYAFGSGTNNHYYKDLVVWNSSGTANNDFLGSVIVYELTTTSDTTLGGWTSTDANGYSVLDNNPPDNAHYISGDSSPPASAVFGLSDLPATVTSVKGLITRVRAAKTDGGDGKMKITMRSGASNAAGSDRPITSAQTYWSDVCEQDPATAAAWLPGAVNTATLVVDRTL
jgi:hypothetical protein